MNRQLEQLLNLVAEAEQRPLTAKEVVQLQTHLTAADGFRRQAGGLQSSLAEARAVRDSLALSVAELTGLDPKDVELAARAGVQRQSRKARQKPQNAP